MGPSNYHPSLGCEVTIKQANNVETRPKGTLFVRYYLSAGRDKRVQLDTQEISSNSNPPTWNQSFSLECLGPEHEDSLNSNLKQQSVVFELRFRSSKPSVLGRRSKSQLLGRAEVPWEAVLESSNMEIKRWVTMVATNSRVLEGVKPPSLLVGMKIRGPKVAEIVNKRRRRKAGGSTKCDGRCCNEFCGCEDSYHVFAFAAALDAL